VWQRATLHILQLHIRLWIVPILFNRLAHVHLHKCPFPWRDLDLYLPNTWFLWLIQISPPPNINDSSQLTQPFLQNSPTYPTYKHIDQAMCNVQEGLVLCPVCSPNTTWHDHCPNNCTGATSLQMNAFTVVQLAEGLINSMRFPGFSRTNFWFEQISSNTYYLCNLRFLLINTYYHQPIMLIYLEQGCNSRRTVASSEPDAMTLSLNGFHLISVTRPRWPHTLPVPAIARPICRKYSTVTVKPHAHLTWN